MVSYLTLLFYLQKCAFKFIYNGCNNLNNIYDGIIYVFYDFIRMYTLLFNDMLLIDFIQKYVTLSIITNWFIIAGIHFENFGINYIINKFIKVFNTQIIWIQDMWSNYFLHLYCILTIINVYMVFVVFFVLIINFNIIKFILCKYYIHDIFLIINIIFINNKFICMHTIITNLQMFMYMHLLNYKFSIYFVLYIYWFNVVIIWNTLNYFNSKFCVLLNFSAVLNYFTSNYTLLFIIIFINIYVLFNIHHSLLLSLIYVLDLNLLSYEFNINLYNLYNYNLLLDNIYLYLHPTILFISIIKFICYIIFYALIVIYYKYSLKKYKYNFYVIINKLCVCIIIALIFGGFWAFIENNWGGFWAWDYSECINLNFLIVVILCIHLYAHNNFYANYYVIIYMILQLIYIYIYIKLFSLNTSHMFNTNLQWFQYNNFLVYYLLLCTAIFFYIYYIYYIYYTKITLLNLLIIYYITYFYFKHMFIIKYLFNLYIYIHIHTFCYLNIMPINIELLTAITINYYYILLILLLCTFSLINTYYLFHTIILIFLCYNYISYAHLITYIDTTVIFNYYVIDNKYYYYFLSNFIFINHINHIINFFQQKIYISLYTNIIFIDININTFKFNLVQYNCSALNLITNNFFLNTQTLWHNTTNYIYQYIYAYIYIIILYFIHIK